MRATRGSEFAAIGSSVCGTLALSRGVRAWAILRGRRYVVPQDVEDLFVPIVLHRIFFKPSFLAEAREIGWRAAGAQVRERCLEVAPRPGYDLALDELPAAAG